MERRRGVTQDANRGAGERALWMTHGNCVTVRPSPTRLVRSPLETAANTQLHTLFQHLLPAASTQLELVNLPAALTSGPEALTPLVAGAAPALFSKQRESPAPHTHPCVSRVLHCGTDTEPVLGKHS